MIAALAAVISLVLFTLFALDHPFGGITRVDSAAFELVRETMERNLER
jgi:hypothetical protein